MVGERLVYSIWCYCFTQINISAASFKVVLCIAHKLFKCVDTCGYTQAEGGHQIEIM